MGSWTNKKAFYQDFVNRIDPAIRLTTKDHWVWSVVAALVHVFTAGGTRYSAFLLDYGTTIGPIVASPRGWPRLSEGYLVHEATHVADCRKASLGLHPWAGLLFFGLAYLLVFFPVLFAWMRYRIELRADTARWRHELREGLKGVGQVRRAVVRRGRALSGGAYGYAWIFAEWGYWRRGQRLISEFLGV